MTPKKTQMDLLYKYCREEVIWWKSKLFLMFLEEIYDEILD